MSSEKNANQAAFTADTSVPATYVTNSPRRLVTQNAPRPPSQPAACTSCGIVPPPKTKNEKPPFEGGGLPVVIRPVVVAVGDGVGVAVGVRTGVTTGLTPGVNNVTVPNAATPFASAVIKSVPDDPPPR